MPDMKQNWPESRQIGHKNDRCEVLLAVGSGDKEWTERVMARIQSRIQEVLAEEMPKLMPPDLAAVQPKPCVGCGPQ